MVSTSFNKSKYFCTHNLADTLIKFCLASIVFKYKKLKNVLKSIKNNIHDAPREEHDSRKTT